MPLPLAPENLRVVLVRTRNPLNLGAAARAISNFGFLHLRTVQPYELAFREARSAVGASAVMKQAEEFSKLADAVADCSLVVGTTTLRNRQPQHPMHRLETAAVAIREALATQRIALLFGSEKVGLSNEDLSHCHWLTHIPTREAHPSMNLGQAVAVCLYELVRTEKENDRPLNPASPQDRMPQSSTAKPHTLAAPDSTPNSAPAADLERLTTTLLDALRTSGYLLEAPTELDETKTRRLIHRLNLDSTDAELLQGMLRQILWKLRAQP
jgi:tRNA/rRNA methyltransferase